MKKLSFKAGLGVILALSFLSSCSNKGSGSERANNSSDAKPAEIKPTIIKESAKEESIVDDANQNEPPSQASLPCRTEDDCALVPNNDCFGCLKQGGSHSVTTKKIAGDMWAQKQETCEPELKEFFEGLRKAKRQLKKEDMSQDPSCQAFNGVACQQKQCVGVLLDDAQLKARAEEMRQRMQQGQSQGQGQGPRQVQGPRQGQGQAGPGPGQGPRQGQGPGPRQPMNGGQNGGQNGGGQPM